MDFISLKSEMKDLLRPLIKKIIVSMEGVASENPSRAIEKCSIPDNIQPISNYIQILKSEGCEFDEFQIIEESDIFVYTDNYINFDIDVYFNGKKRHNGFFAVFSAKIDAKEDFLRFETIKT